MNFLAAVKYWLQCAGAVGAVYEAGVVFLRQVPVGCVALYEARDDNEAQNHQIDAREDLIHQRRLVHAKGQKSWGQEEERRENSDFSTNNNMSCYVGGCVRSS